MSEGDIFDFITADTPEGEEFADALREETEIVEIDGRTVDTGTDRSGGTTDD